MSYELFKVGKVWHYRFQIARARVQRSTREILRHKADAIATQAYEEAKYVARGKSMAPTLVSLIESWLTIHRPVSSVSHIKSVDTFRRLHLYGLGDTLICDITTEMVELSRNEHLRTHAPASANHWLKILKLLMQWALSRGLLLGMPWRVKLLKLQKRPRSTLPTKMAGQWLEALDAATIKDPSIGTAVRMMLGLGLRELEAAGAMWSWLDWDRGTYTPGKTKGREADPLPVPMWIMSHLRDVSAARAAEALPLIAPSRKGGAHRSGFARKAMRVANKAVGIEGITPHRLRGTYATQLGNEGLSIQMIQKALRHKSPMTTMSYLEVDMEAAIAAQARLSKKMNLELPARGEVDFIGGPGAHTPSAAGPC